MGFKNDKIENIFGNLFPAEEHSSCYFQVRNKERLIRPSLLSICLSSDPETLVHDTFNPLPKNHASR